MPKETISRITDKVLEETASWCSRPLDGVYAAIFIDAVMVKVWVLSLILWAWRLRGPDPTTMKPATITYTDDRTLPR